MKPHKLISQTQVIDSMTAQEEQEHYQNMSSSYPLDPNSYDMLQKIGIGVSASVYKAACLSMNSQIVAIKAIDLERSRANLDDVRREAKSMALLSHPNILKAHCSFTVDHHLWVVMPFMSAGSLHSIISSSFPDGLNESSIAVVLKETLNALLYLHDQGLLHRDIKAGNILVDSDGSVKLADFGVSASIYEPNPSHPTFVSSSSSNLRFNDLAGTPYWMAPEVIHSHVGYSFKADIWSFGITALELAHGRPPLSHLPPWKSLFMRITNRLGLLDFEKNRKSNSKKFSKNFKDMVASCLSIDPARRPTAEKLLKHPFFKNCRSVDSLAKNVLQGLPTVEQRYRESLRCRSAPQVSTNNEAEEEEEEEDPFASPIEKHRRISGWNFNEDVLEMDPVFPICEPFQCQTEGNEGQFCEESEIGNQMNNGEVEEYREMDAEEHEEYEANSSNTSVESEMVATAPLVPRLKALMDSIEDERQVVSNLIALIGGEDVGMSRNKHFQQTIAQLTLQLEQERMKSSTLEKELELYRHADNV